MTGSSSPIHRSDEPHTARVPMELRHLLFLVVFQLFCFFGKFLHPAFIGFQAGV